MRHAAILELLAERHEAQLLVEADLVGLGGEVELRLAARARQRHGELHHPAGRAAAARMAADDDAADLYMLGQEQDAQRPDDVAVIKRNDVRRGEVVGVELLGGGDMLLADEHVAAKRKRKVAQVRGEGDGEDYRVGHEDAPAPG